MSKSINSQEFQTEVLEGNLVLVDFWATWCAPCRMIAPILDELSDENKGKLNVVKVDVDQNRDIAQKYQIMSIPSVFLFKNGEVVEKMIGVQSKDSMQKVIDNHLS